MGFPSSFTPKLAACYYPLLYNLDVRRAIIAALNLHSSDRALARFCAALVDSSPKIFKNTRKNIHDACLGRESYKDLILQNDQFGREFIKLKPTDGSIIGFGHEGSGGSTTYYDINNRFAISMTINKLPSGTSPVGDNPFYLLKTRSSCTGRLCQSRDFTENSKIN